MTDNKPPEQAYKLIEDAVLRQVDRSPRYYRAVNKLYATVQELQAQGVDLMLETMYESRVGVRAECSMVRLCAVWSQGPSRISPGYNYEDSSAALIRVGQAITPTQQETPTREEAAVIEALARSCIE